MLDTVLELVHEGFVNAATLLAAPLFAALVASIVMAALQTITSMHDATISLVPRLVVTVGTLVLLSPWIVARLIAFMADVLQWNGSGSFGG